MILFGKVKEYNGFNGIIKGVDNKDYILQRKEVSYDNVIDVNDKVYFEPDYVETPETKEYIARFVKKLDNKKELSK